MQGHSEQVERAVRAVDRRQFLPPNEVEHAALDRPLPIGFSQTISQPSLVAEMTRELRVDRRHRVLEVGTGSGYQTAILAELANQVFTIERILELAETAQLRLQSLGYRNIEFRVGDGAAGWPEAAPFDRIIVTAAPADVPPALVQQLARGGRLVIPVGPDVNDQTLVLIEKSAGGEISRHELFAVRFVPLVSE